MLRHWWVVDYLAIRIAVLMRTVGQKRTKFVLGNPSRWQGDLSMRNFSNPLLNLAHCGSGTTVVLGTILLLHQGKRILYQRSPTIPEMWWCWDQYYVFMFILAKYNLICWFDDLIWCVRGRECQALRFYLRSLTMALGITWRTDNIQRTRNKFI